MALCLGGIAQLFIVLVRDQWPGARLRLLDLEREAVQKEAQMKKKAWQAWGVSMHCGFDMFRL